MNATCKAVILSVKFALALESLARLAVNTNYNMLSDNYKPSLNKQHFLLAPLCPAIPLHQLSLSSLVVFINYLHLIEWNNHNNCLICASPGYEFKILPHLTSCDQRSSVLHHYRTRRLRA